LAIDARPSLAATLWLGNRQIRHGVAFGPRDKVRALKKLDKVAYVRFASVYRSFEDIDEFRTLVDEVSK
jgi:hypothetical protein